MADMLTVAIRGKKWLKHTPVAPKGTLVVLGEHKDAYCTWIYARYQDAYAHEMRFDTLEAAEKNFLYRIAQKGGVLLDSR